MAFNKDQWSKASSGNPNDQTAQFWSYKATPTDSLATVLASGYFNDRVLELQNGDLIWAVCNDDSELMLIISATGATPVLTRQITGNVANLPLASSQIFVGDGSGNAAAVAMSGDATITLAGAVSLSAASVAAAQLDNTSISHYPFSVIRPATVGGSAVENFAIAGLLATDQIVATMYDQGAVPVTILTAGALAGQARLEFSADPAADHIVTIAVYRAVP